MNTEVEFGKLGPMEKWFLWAYIFSFALDFKGQPGGSLPQFIMAGLSIVAGIGFIIFQSRKMQSSSELTTGTKKITILWWAYLLSTIFTGVISEVTFGRYIRIFFPLLLCGISLLIICKCQKRLIDPYKIINPLLIASVVSIIWRAYYAIQIMGIDIYSMRYQLLNSGGINLVFAYVIGNIVSRRPINAFGLFGLCLAIIASLLSITRSLILMVLFLILGYSWLAFKTPLHINIKKHLSLVLIILLTCIPAFYIAEELRPGFLESWADRTLAYRYTGGSLISDLTLVTRVAEWSGQWQSLSGSLLSLCFGEGIGSEYYWDLQYLFGFERFLGFKNLQNRTGWYSGHSMWVYSVYSGGLLFGWVIIAISFSSLLRIMTFIRGKQGLVPRRFQETAPVLFFAILAFISQGFTSSPLVDRFYATIIGLVFGMAYYFSDYVKREEAQQIG
jgi:hypothetical protein